MAAKIYAEADLKVFLDLSNFACFFTLLYYAFPGLCI